MSMTTSPHVKNQTKPVHFSTVVVYLCLRKHTPILKDVRLNTAYIYYRLHQVVDVVAAMIQEINSRFPFAGEENTDVSTCQYEAEMINWFTFEEPTGLK